MFRITIAILVCAIAAVALAFGGAAYVFIHYGRDLPDFRQLAAYEPPVVTRVHAGDGRLLAEFAVEKRAFVPITAIPNRVVQAFLAAEDKNFYNHPGIDAVGIVRAAVTNLSRMGDNRRPSGASTITQQVAKNFLLGNEMSMERKIKEAILAFRIENALSKDRILELYLNEIYLGFGSYGVAAAALNYFNKALDELTIGEVAFLAGLPKAPSNYNPMRQPEQARGRRDYVLGRMVEDGYITLDELRSAAAEPVRVRRFEGFDVASADYFVEEVRRQLLAQYGEKGLYSGGLSVRTTLDPRLQEIADRTLRAGLISYDRRHGWRGPLGKVAAGGNWQQQLANLPRVPELPGWQRALVTKLEERGAEIAVEDGKRGLIPMTELRWARATKEHQRLGPTVQHPRDVVAVGDLILVERLENDGDGKPLPANTYGLRQIPDVGGAVVALDPHTGRVFAMSGGLSYAFSQYNRATQAKRQPGSAFKPFVYLAALDRGFTPSSLILDAPFVLDLGPGLGTWRPSNYSHTFSGPTTMRRGLEQSKNLMTVRLAQSIGIDSVAKVAERFHVVDELPRMLSMALGAGETTVLRLTAAYAMFVNGGHEITPTLIDRVQERHGRTIFRHDQRPCEHCTLVSWNTQEPPSLPDDRPQVADPRQAFQIVNMLQGVVERGTGVRIRSVGKPLAGKTGTTNDSNDAWFIGFSPDLAVGVFVGFDQPKSLGPAETGASVAVPIFRDFMAEALKDTPAVPFRTPPGLRMVRVDPESGLPARGGAKLAILEAFIPGTEPGAESADRRVLDGSESGEPQVVVPRLDPGGLY